MAIFEEKKTGQCGTILLLALLFVLSYPFWHLGDYELFGNEAEYAVALTEMLFWPPVTLGHGHLLENVYPLFLVGAKGLMLCGLPAALA